MENFDDLLEQFDGQLSTIRNATKLSLFAEKLIVTFLKSGVKEARIKHELTEFDINTLQKGLYNVTRKKAYMNMVQLHRQNNQLILVRKR